MGGSYTNTIIHNPCRLLKLRATRRTDESILGNAVGHDPGVVAHPGSEDEVVVVVEVVEKGECSSLVFFLFLKEKSIIFRNLIQSSISSQNTITRQSSSSWLPVMTQHSTTRQEVQWERMRRESCLATYPHKIKQQWLGICRRLRNLSRHTSSQDMVEAVHHCRSAV